MRLTKKLGDVFRAKLVENRVVNRPRTGKTGDELLDNLRLLDSPASFLRLRDIALVNRVNQSNSPPLSEFSLKRPHRLGHPINKPRHSPLFRIEHAGRQCSKNQGIGKRLGFLRPRFRQHAPSTSPNLRAIARLRGPTKHAVPGPAADGGECAAKERKPRHCPQAAFGPSTQAFSQLVQRQHP